MAGRRFLYWVFRPGGFAAAAKHLHSTQSAVSMRIQDLESSLGVPLFDRNQRSARLTANTLRSSKNAKFSRSHKPSRSWPGNTAPSKNQGKGRPRVGERGSPTPRFRVAVHT
ncbi:MAG: LysR family transcriptional regulator [Betaproteobacteria bacterium]|nr:LysR family transcriptional regulator [Betaproteobacteria bacterium]